MKLSNERLLELLNNLIEYVDMLKDSESTEDQAYFWQEIIGLTKEEVEFFGFTYIDDLDENEEDFDRSIDIIQGNRFDN